MPVFSTRLPCVITVALATFLVTGCSGKKTSTEPVIPPAPDVAEGSPEELIQTARAELERGEELAHRGEWTEAREAFDRAVDLLLGLPGGASSSEEAESLYNEVVDTIYETERASLDALAAELEQADVAAVDELTSDETLDAIASATPEDIAEADLPEITYDIPIVMNQRVLSIIEMFQDRRHDWFQDAIDRSGFYAPMIREIFAEEGIPQDLMYLAMVESAFKTRAVSRAGARGMWQFIRGTGRLYGLQQTFWIDDRFDPEKATRAAARHLKDLYDELGDWYLVMAAYNSGQRRVERAIRRTGSRDFWEHARRRVLPRETRSYVPLIIATTVIAKNPEAYGFAPSPNTPLDYDVVRLDHPVDLSTAAKSAGVSLDDMKELNPELRRWVTPLDHDSYPLRIPLGSSEQFKTALAEIPEDERVRFGTHVVLRGDTLSRIAQRYGTSVSALTAANNISARSLIHPGQVLTVPVPPGSGAERIRRAQRREIIPQNGQDVYVVQRGDTLGEISTAFRMSLSELRALNGMAPRATRIYPGQKLIVSEGAAAKLSTSARVSRSQPIGDAATYVVRPGDTLGQIAEDHGIGLSTLRRLNGFSGRHSRIYAGQTLYVSETTVASLQSSSGPVSYRIRRGDTLSKIARRFGVTVEDIRAWNSINSDRIVAGERLTIHVSAGTN